MQLITKEYTKPSPDHDHNELIFLFAGNRSRRFRNLQRTKKILTLVNQGKKNPEIAQKLSVSQRVVRDVRFRGKTHAAEFDEFIKVSREKSHITAKIRLLPVYYFKSCGKCKTGTVRLRPTFDSSDELYCLNCGFTISATPLQHDIENDRDLVS